MLQPTEQAIALGRRLAQLRKTQKLYQHQLAERVDVSRGTVVQYEAGVINPPLAMIHKLAEVLDAPPEYIAFGVRAEKKSEEGTHPQSILKIELVIPVQLDSYRGTLEIQPS